MLFPSPTHTLTALVGLVWAISPSLAELTITQPTASHWCEFAHSLFSPPPPLRFSVSLLVARHAVSCRDTLTSKLHALEKRFDNLSLLGPSSNIPSAYSGQSLEP